MACAALVGLLAYGMTANATGDSIDQALAEGKRPSAPEQTLPELGAAGEAKSLSDYRGQVVVVNVWATWCKPCVDELPLLERAHERMQKSNGLVLGINREDFTEKALTMNKELGLTFPSLRDRDGQFTQEHLQVARVPETFVLDRKGRIAAHRAGQIDQKWLDETLPPLLAEKA